MDLRKKKIGIETGGHHSVTTVDGVLDPSINLTVSSIGVGTGVCFMVRPSSTVALL
jgi:hypothetical protein